MNGLLIHPLLEFLFWWCLAALGYFTAIIGLDQLLTAWQQWQERQSHLKKVDAELRASIQRLATEFVIASDEMRCITQREVSRR